MNFTNSILEAFDGLQIICFRIYLAFPYIVIIYERKTTGNKQQNYINIVNFVVYCWLIVFNYTVKTHKSEINVFYIKYKFIFYIVVNIGK